MLLENAYNGAILYVEDYRLENIVDIIIKYGHLSKMCTLDLNKVETYDGFLELHIFKYIEKSVFLKLQYE